METTLKRGFDWRILLLAAVAFGCFGCSTPEVPEYDSESFASATQGYDAYVSCVEVLVTYGREHECDRIRTADGRGYSYDYYNGTDYNYYQGKAQIASAQLTPEQKDAAYAAYLSQLDPSAVDEMTRQWQQLAKDAQKK
jgi:hypothetical protein